MVNWKQYIISETFTIRQALTLLDRIGVTSGVLFVINGNQELVGSITDGDIRRGLIRNALIDDKVTQIIFKKFRYFNQSNISPEKIKAYKDYGIRYIPVIDDNKKVVDVIDLHHYKTILAVDAVIMAGGKGQRLMPLTKDTPKPMLMVGSKPLLEHNVDRFIQYGIQHIFISINYLGNKISEYFGDGSDKGVDIQYLEEEQPLGTIGVLAKKEALFVADDILIMNSDLLTNIDFTAFYNSFKEADADMAVATVPHSIDLPYAILEVTKNEVISLHEKPTYTYFANAGIYIIKKSIINLIPAGEKFDTTTLMDKIIELKLKLVQFPILEYWLDIGRISDYQKAQEDVSKIKF